MVRSTIRLFANAVMFALVTIRVAAIDAQETGSQQTAAETKPAAQEMPWLVPQRDYRGDLWNRSTLTGDWGGLRQKLMDNGVRFDFSLTQTIQGNAAGGKKDQFDYAARGVFGVKLDTGHAGLWPGGMLVIRGEGRYGPDDNRNTGALMPVDMNALFPVPGQDIATLSELYYLQFLTPWLGVMAGKMSPRGANVFAHDETEQFLNLAFNIDPVIGTTLPVLCTLAAGGILRPTEWFMLNTLALDSEGGCDKSGFHTVLKRGTSLLQQAEFTIKPFGLPGHQRVGWTWSDRSQTQFSQSPIDIIDAIITGNTSGLKRVKTDWSFIYDFDQYLYLQPGSTDRGLGLFGNVGAGNKVVNIIQGFYSIGLTGKGLVPGREKDSFGIGYYYIHLSEDLPRVVKNRARDEQGVELYYNVAVTPWLHLTPDLQILRPANKRVNTTLVGGVRMKVEF